MLKAGKKIEQLNVGRVGWKAIVAQNPAGVIGLNGGIPWKNREDQKWFQKTTWGQTLLVGHKTYQSFHGRKLPNRQIIILSRTKRESSETEQWIQNIEEADRLCRTETIWVAGGAEIYQIALHRCQELYRSIINWNGIGDRYMAKLDPAWQKNGIIHYGSEFYVEHWTQKKG